MKINQEILRDVVSNYGFFTFDDFGNEVHITIYIATECNYGGEYDLYFEIEDDFDSFLDVLEGYAREYDPDFETYEIISMAVANHENFNALHIATDCDTLKYQLLEMYSALKYKLESK